MSIYICQGSSEPPELDPLRGRNINSLRLSIVITAEILAEIIAEVVIKLAAN